METAAPKGRRWRSILTMNLFSFPAPRGLGQSWRSVVFANRSTRREAKALLFGELAEAARRGVPLHEALRLASQTADEEQQSRWRPMGADTRHGTLGLIYSIALSLFFTLGWSAYAILSFRYADVERVARVLALRLLRHVERGHSLADAMARGGLDYDPSEIALIRAGAQWGRVPEALKRIAEFQTVENQLTGQGAQMMYPIVLTAFLTMPISFVLVKVVPRYVDIFSQIGAELPGLTKAVINNAGLLMSLPFTLCALAAAFLLLRALMNGNSISKWPVLVPGLGLLFGGFFGLFAFFESKPDIAGFMEEGLPALIAAAAGFAWLVLSPWVLSLLERIVLEGERIGAILQCYLPLFHTPARIEAESRWLAGLALALEAGVTEPEAVISAGDVCGGGIRSRSRDAARLIAAGHGIGEACLRERVLSETMNHRVALIGLSENPAKGLRAAADDAAQDAFERINRAGRIAEVFSILGVGVVLALLVAAMYLPLFSIPMIVGL